MQTDPSSGIYNLDHYDMNEKLGMIAVSRKPFKGLSCSANVRTNLEPESDKEASSRIVCVKLKDDIHNPRELKVQMMALKEHVKTGYRLSNFMRAPKNDKMTSNLSKWIRTGVKGTGDLEEDSYKIYKEQPVQQGTEGLTLPNSRWCGGLQEKR